VAAVEASPLRPHSTDSVLVDALLPRTARMMTVTSAANDLVSRVVATAGKPVVCLAFGVRTGSTLLCHDLAELVGGTVHGELFQEHCYPTDPVGIAHHVEAAMADDPAGVFVFKLSWSQAWELRRRLADGGDPWSVSLPAVFPGARFLHLRRLDKVAQTVSAWRARCTGEWHVPGGSEVSATDLSDFRPEDLVADVLVLASEEHRWWTQFRDWDTTALDLTYEAYTTNRLATLREIAAFLDLAAPTAITWPEPLRKLGGPDTDAAVEQLRRHLRCVLPSLIGGTGAPPETSG
jgi:LPS sulfotransferase NodH